MGRNVINVVVGVLVLSVVLLGVQNLRLSNAVKAAKNELIAMQEEVKQRLVVERTQVKQDMREKYQADRVSYEAMGKMVERLRTRLREAEERLGEAGIPLE